MNKLLDNKRLKQNCFNVPDNYFNGVYNRFSELFFKNSIKTHVSFKRRISLLYSSVAASAIIIFMSCWYLANLQNNKYYQMAEDYISKFSVNTFDGFLVTEEQEEYTYNETLINEINYAFIMNTDDE